MNQRFIQSVCVLAATYVLHACLSGGPDSVPTGGPKIEQHQPGTNGTGPTALIDPGNVNPNASNSDGGMPPVRAESFTVARRFPAPDDFIAPNVKSIAVEVQTDIAVPLQLILAKADGTAVDGTSSAANCSEQGWRAATCVRFTPAADLIAATAYSLILQTESPENALKIWVLNFTTTAERDSQAPSLPKVACGMDEKTEPWGCSLRDDTRWVFRLQPSESLRMGVVAAATGSTSGTPIELAPPILYQEAGFTYAVFAPPNADELSATLTVHDAAGNATEFSASATEAPTLPTLTISEVRADPLGPEPHQEYIELFNFGTEAVALEGVTISDDVTTKGNSLTGAVTLAPKSYALLVGKTFDPANTLDVAPASGTALIAVADKLVTRGLSNSGETLYLRDRSGHRISTFSSLPAPKPGVCIVRASSDLHDTQNTRGMRTGEPDAFAYAPDQRCTPGAP